MKILWFTNTPSLASDYFEFKGKGGGWLQGLEKAITKDNNIELAIAFHNFSSKNSIQIGKTQYFPIKNKENLFPKNFNKHIFYLNEKQYLNEYIEIIDNYKPDIIHIFGTEMSYSRILDYTNIPTCIHIQGFISDCKNYFLNNNVSSFDLFFHSGIKKILAANTIYHTYKLFEKVGKRELNQLSKCKFYLGRTDYDAKYISKHAPDATYFYCSEILRDDFYYADKWIFSTKEKLVLLTTNNGEVYKGIDIILKTAQLLKNSGLNFEWRIVGINKYNPGLKIFERKLKISHNDVNITLLGTLNSNELIKELQNSSFFIHPSKIDNSPNSVCEAQMIGIPTIAINTGGLSSLIAEDINGWLVSESSEDLYNKIINIIKVESKLISVSKNAIDTAEKRHNINSILQDLNNVYKYIYEYNYRNI